MAVTRMPVAVHAGSPDDGTRPVASGGGIRRALRALGWRPLVLVGFLAELGWSFVGSLGFGLGMSASTAGPGEARLWLVGACLIGITIASLVHLAGVEKG